MINFIIFVVLLIFFIYEWATRTDRLIAFALKIYFGYRRKGFSVIDAQEEVVKTLALPQKREDIFKEKELLPEKGAPFLHLFNSNLKTNKTISNIKSDVKLLILALCIQKTFTRIRAKKFLSYQEKINKIYERISKKYPEIEESERSKVKELTDDGKELTGEERLINSAIKLYIDERKKGIFTVDESLYGIVNNLITTPLQHKVWYRFLYLDNSISEIKHFLKKGETILKEDGLEEKKLKLLILAIFIEKLKNPFISREALKDKINKYYDKIIRNYPESERIFK